MPERLVLPAPFSLPVAVRIVVDTIFPDGMPAKEVARVAPEHDFTIAAAAPDHLLLRHANRAYVRLPVSPDGHVLGRIVLEGEPAAELDRHLWFNFRGIRDRIIAVLAIGTPARDVAAALRAMAPIGFQHVTSAYREDLGSLRLYHFVGGGVIGLEVDPLGTVTAANMLPPKVGQGTVVAIEAQERDASPAWTKPRSARSLRAALDDVVERGADIVGVRELDPAGDTIEITGRRDDGTRRYRYALGRTAVSSTR